MRVISFNINGLRSVLGSDSNLDKFLLSLPDADIICLQETKINLASSLTPSLVLLDHFHSYYSFHHDKYLLNSKLASIGYAGVGSFYKKQGLAPYPHEFEEGFTTVFNPSPSSHPPSSHHPYSISSELMLLQNIDAESRCIVTYHTNFVMLNTYCPNNADSTDRQFYRKIFYHNFWKRALSFLEQGLSIIWAGDINICYHPRDHCEYALDYAALCKTHGEENVEQAILKYVESYEETDVDDKEDEESAPSANSNKNSGNNNIDIKPTYNLSNLLELITAFYGHNFHRRWLFRLLNIDPVAKSYHIRDSFRSIYPYDLHAYTCWNTLTNARQSNYGSRIDMIFIAGENFHPSKCNIKSAGILKDIGGSDHCPIYIDFDCDKPDHINQKAVVPWNTKHLLGQQRLVDCFKRQHSSSEVYKSDNNHELNAKSNTSTINNQIVQMPANKKSKVSINNFFIKPPGSVASYKDIATEEGVINLVESDEEEYLDDSRPDIVIDSYNNKSDDNTLSASADCKTRVKTTFTTPNPPVVPLCKKHREPCTIFTVNKKGPNRGRKFYLCSRPVGNAKDPNARCDHFEWYLPPINSKASLQGFLVKQVVA